MTIQADAAALVCAVAERDVAESHRILLSLDLEGTRQLAVQLASYIDPELPMNGQHVPADAYRGTVAKVITAVAAATGVDAEDIYGRTLARHVTAARHVACWVAMQLGVTSVQIGKSLERDHSTVLHAVARVAIDAKLHGVAREVLDQFALAGAA